MAADVFSPTTAALAKAAGYLTAAGLCLWRADRRSPSWRRPEFWRVAAVLTAVIGLATPTGLLDGMTRAGREEFRTTHDYADRRPYQAAAVGVTGIATLVGVLLAMRAAGPDRGRRLAAVGVCWLVGFAAVRAISLHAIDGFLAIRVGPFTVNLVCELAGLATVTTGALSRSRPPPGPAC